ncbi:MAG: VPLPA-CTERM sorting domain-containing protein [Sulfuricaulis sp.]
MDIKKFQKMFYGGCIGLLLSGGAQAASVSYYLNENNISLPANNYGLVTLTDISGGGVKFTITPENLTPDTNFGVQEFGFSSDLTLSSANFVLPSGWNSGTTVNLDGFGSFADVTNGTGSSRQNPLTFSVNIGNITDYQFLNNKKNYFAAHIAGFSNGGANNSGYFASNTIAAVPVPAAAWLFGSGLIGLAGAVRKRKPS